MENGEVGLNKNWCSTAARTKLESFLMLAKMRLSLSVKCVWRAATGTDDLPTAIASTVVLPATVVDNLVEWLAQEIRENVALLHMANGDVIVADDVIKPIEFLNDVHTYCGGNSLAVAERRLEFALDAMEFFARSSPIVERARLVWSPALKLARSLNDAYGKRVEDLCEILGVLQAADQRNGDDGGIVKLKKFRDNDDLYVLQHGFEGYTDALDRILKKIGGKQWDMQVLEVLERKAGMITEFHQIRLLVDVLPSVHSMVDMRIQQSLNRIFKAAFNNLKFSVKKEVINYYYQKYQVWSTSEMDPEYSTELNLIINNLSMTTKGKYRVLASRLCWHFMLNAKNCWWRIATAVMTTPNLLEPVIELLRVLPPVVSLRLPSDKNGNKIQNVGNRLILEGWGRLLEQKLVDTEDQETVWSDFVLRLCNGLPKRPIIEATEIVRTFLSPVLTQRPALILSGLCKIFRDKSTRLQWNNTTGGVPSSPSATTVAKPSGDLQNIDSIGLFASIFELFGRASRAGHPDNALNLEVRVLCPRALSSLVERWQYDGFTLPAASFDWLKSRIDALPWIQQVFCFWLLRECCVDGAALIDAPECLHCALALPHDRYRLIDCPPISKQHQKIDCALKSMIEAACFASDLGLIFLRDGSFRYFVDVSLPKVRDHLLFAISTIMVDRNLDEWKNVIEWLKVFFDKLDENVNCNDVLCAYPDQRLGYKFVAPVSIFADVTILMLMKHNVDGQQQPQTPNANYSATLKLWLQNFYSVARDFQTYALDKLSTDAAKEAALHRMWSVCSALLKSFGDENVARPVQMDWLFQGLFETWRRCNMQLMREMLEDVKPYLSVDVADNMLRRLAPDAAVADSNNAADA